MLGSPLIATIAAQGLPGTDVRAVGAARPHSPPDPARPHFNHLLE